MLLALNTRSSLSIVPMKLPASEPIAFPESPHAEFATDCQLAFPVTSVVSIYQFIAPVVRRSPMNAPVHATSSLYDGLLVPIPTFAPAHPRIIAPV